jgi:hypothetical protein
MTDTFYQRLQKSQEEMAELLFYLWHSAEGGAGGPSFTITPMPSAQVCEAVGRAAKEMVDRSQRAYELHAPAQFRCVVMP